MKIRMTATMTWTAEFEVESISFEDAMQTVRAMDNAEFYDGVHDEQVNFTSVEEVK